MNYYKKLSSTRSKAKIQRWLSILVLGFIVMLGTTIIGCEKEDESNDADEYYVKYEVNSTTIYLGGKLDVTLNTEANEALSTTIDQRKLWETVIGPVQRGFNATLKVKAAGETHDKLELYTNIYVSKNDSPFALKKSDGSEMPRDSVELHYTIDY